MTDSRQVYEFVSKGEELTVEVLRGPKRLKVKVQPEIIP